MLNALLLILAAMLEVGGDAFVRRGLRAGVRTGGIWALLLGAALLVIYGVSVNLPKWDFGRLMGVYIALFFLVAQGVSVLFFRERVTVPIMVGGLLIVSGGILISVWHA